MTGVLAAVILQNALQHANLPLVKPCDCNWDNKFTRIHTRLCYTWHTRDDGGATFVKRPLKLLSLFPGHTVRLNA